MDNELFVSLVSSRLLEYCLKHGDLVAEELYAAEVKWLHDYLCAPKGELDD